MSDISQGGVVDQEALARLLKEGHLAGAVLYVFDTEPLPEESPLWDLENVLITPHVSGTTPLYMERAVDVSLRNLGALSAGELLVTPVDVGVGY